MKGTESFYRNPAPAALTFALVPDKPIYYAADWVNFEIKVSDNNGLVKENVWLNYAILDSNSFYGIGQQQTNPSLISKLYLENDIIFPSYGRAAVQAFLDRGQSSTYQEMLLAT